MSGPPMPAPDRLSEELLLAFAPLHKAAFGLAVGIASGLLLFGVTAIVILRHAQDVINLNLLAPYLRNYSMTWKGAFIGAAWATFAGFVFGWFTAFVRNLVLAISLFMLRTRAELAQTRDFLDHI
jgi:hypothetical protein